MRKIGMLLFAVVVLLGGAVAYASIPASDGTINGCYRTTNGDLRVIDSTETCETDETALNWNPGAVSGIVRKDESYSLPAGQTVTLYPVCDAGYTAISGGYDTGWDHQTRPYVSLKFTGAAEAWLTRFVNEDTVTRNVTAYTFCAPEG